MRFLIVKVAAIGDVIMATSMVHALRVQHPDCEITWMVGGAAHGLLQHVPGIDRLILVDDVGLLTGGRGQKMRAVLSAWKALGRQLFDRIFIAHSDRRYALLALSARGERRGLYDQRGGLIPGRHHSVEYARLATGIDGPDMHPGTVPRLDPATVAASHPLPAPRCEYVLMAPGGAKNALRDSPQRRWPVENYAEIARRLRRDGLDVVLTGAASDSWVLPAFADTGVIDMIGKTDWPGLLALVAGTRAVLTHDSMMAHLPRLFGTPTLVLVGPTSPASFFMPNLGFDLIRAPNHMPCRPCYDGKELFNCLAVNCMNDIEVNSVSTSLNRVMNKNNSRFL